ncbi:Fe2+ transport system protein FeoA [Motilibacter rhizosphaerae]|uniref:Fe2+ transport system protein FeoA n=1 Tax=Motilibacter rhizosphaerae TaxID=598652 RepID=A0A4Q7NAQ6_9ACTN|nr:FeoA family protein [Motilibacter rhizosphaerae]RZS80021.1 Fe2+ transport system protein FeoA [Motilibacter rhizosphaerae]
MTRNLSDCDPGDACTLRRVLGPRPQARRLLELGLVPGTALRVVARGATGGLLVAAGTARVAVDATVARLLVVDAPAAA